MGEDGEEVFVEGFGDLEEEVGVEAFALEDVIYVGAFATDFARKPRGGAFLCLKFLLDEFAYMYHKKTWSFCYLSPQLKALALPIKVRDQAIQKPT